MHGAQRSTALLPMPSSRPVAISLTQTISDIWPMRYARKLLNEAGRPDPIPNVGVLG